MMNDTGRAIIAEINKKSKTSRFAPYISKDQFKVCIRMHCQRVEETFALMLKRGMAVLSRSGRAVKLAPGLREGFNPYLSGSIKDCEFFADLMCRKAMAEAKAVQEALRTPEGPRIYARWIEHWYFDGLYVSETHSPTSTLIDDPLRVAKVWIKIGSGIPYENYEEYYYNLPEVMAATAEHEKRVATRSKREAEHRQRILEENEPYSERECPLKTGPFKVDFIEYMSWYYQKRDNIIDAEEYEPKLLTWYFNSAEEAERFAKHIDHERLDNTVDEDYETEQDIIICDYDLQYCGVA